jgi:radical SAM protein with 4Fe4S-binding SPASM domain
MKLERASIEVFGGCNYLCSMCPQTTGRGKDWTRKMPFDMFTDLLDQIAEKHGTPVINLQGSGEPTLAKDLPKYIEECTKRRLPTYIYSNGYLMKDVFMRDCFDAGLSHFRFSIIGYDRNTYAENMGKDNFDIVIGNLLEAKRYAGHDKVSSYHLILDNNQVEAEVEAYKNNIIFPIGCQADIWRQHNWSGNYESVRVKDLTKARTCGRPFAPEVTIRAGGINGKKGAVVPCCQVLGPPNEQKSVLGHVSDNSIEEILASDSYTKLKEMHTNKDWPDYCKNCDFLYDAEDVLVWSNRSKSTDTYLGTSIDLKEFRAN